MTKLKSLVEILGVITGATVRHNHALNELKETLNALREFLNTCSKPDIFDDNIGPARIEITSLMYQMRMKSKMFGNIREKGLRPLLRDVYHNLESVRVDIFNPSKGRFDLKESLSRLNVSFQILEEAVSGIEYR